MRWRSPFAENMMAKSKRLDVIHQGTGIALDCTRRPRRSLEHRRRPHPDRPRGWFSRRSSCWSFSPLSCDMSSLPSARLKPEALVCHLSPPPTLTPSTGNPPTPSRSSRLPLDSTSPESTSSSPSPTSATLLTPGPSAQNINLPEVLHFPHPYPRRRKSRSKYTWWPRLKKPCERLDARYSELAWGARAPPRRCYDVGSVS